MIAPLILFPSHPEFSEVVIAILAFGDGSATVAGLLLQGPKLPWNAKKTWAGFLAFPLLSIPIATLYYACDSWHLVSWDTALLVVGTTVLVSDVVESLPTSINDNIRVGLTANAVIILLHLFVVGW